MVKQFSLFCLMLLAAYSSVPAGELTAGAAPVTMLDYRDSDRDGVPDYLDACPGSWNIGSDDSDGDRVIDACDLDPIGKGIFSR